MSIYVALTQIKISDESGSLHTLSRADLRRRTAAAPDEAGRRRYGITRRRALVHPISHPYQGARILVRSLWRTSRIKSWRTSLAALAPKTPAGGYAAQAACQRSSSDPVSSAGKVAEAGPSDSTSSGPST